MTETEDPAIHPDWRLLQVFMSTRSMQCFHVYVHIVNRTLVCDCPGTEARRRTNKAGECDHIAYVRKRIDQSKGGYPVEAEGAPQLTSEIAADPEKFREWMLRYSPIVNL